MNDVNSEFKSRDTTAVMHVQEDGILKESAQSTVFDKHDGPTFHGDTCNMSTKSQHLVSVSAKKNVDCTTDDTGGRCDGNLNSKGVMPLDVAISLVAADDPACRLQNYFHVRPSCDQIGLERNVSGLIGVMECSYSINSTDLGCKESAAPSIEVCPSIINTALKPSTIVNNHDTLEAPRPLSLFSFLFLLSTHAHGYSPN